MENNTTQTFLPERIRTYLNERGLNNTILEHNKITWDGERIVIPIFDVDGVWLFNKYRRDPAVTDGPKYTYDKGSKSALYGIDKIAHADKIIICEGEFDALILEANGFVGVSSTGGSGTFKQEWLDMMVGKELFMCFDNDDAGRKGMLRITNMMPDIKCIPLPIAKDHGDITDYFMAGNTASQFKMLMKASRPLIVPQEPKKKKPKRAFSKDGSRLQKAKAVPVETIMEFNKRGFAKCPFHNEKTPSLHLIKNSNKWYCFGCSETGDVIDLVMKLRGISSIGEAINYLLSL